MSQGVRVSHFDGDGGKYKRNKTPRYLKGNLDVLRQSSLIQVIINCEKVVSLSVLDFFLPLDAMIEIRNCPLAGGGKVHS